MIRLALFAAALAAAFAAAFAVGRWADVGERSVGEDDASHAEADMLAGLAVEADGYRFEADRDVLEAGRAGSYTFRIVGPDGRVARDFDVEQERRLHLVAVRRELDRFLHVHPEQRPDGAWVVRLNLPEPGVYRVFADFTIDGERRTLGRDLFAGGSGAARAEPPRYDVSLQRDGDRLRFRVTDAGAPVRLDRYLGARGHLVVLREGDLAYLHAHADDDELAFDVPFAGAGRYRAFLQFKVGGSVHTASLGVAA